MKKQKNIPEEVAKEFYYSMIGFWVHLSRAYEIAKLGGFSIKIVYQTEYKEASDDYQAIKKFYSDVKFSSDGDLVIEITKPDDYNSKRKYETLEDINNRVELAKNNIKPTEYVSDSCNALLKTATYRLNFSLLDVEKINNMASTIAQLDGSNVIRVEHIAEAIQYRSFLDGDEHGVIAEDNIVMFGSNIKITRADILPEHIDSAIAYLEKLKTLHLH